MEEIVKRSLLYDFYGELLTEHQKSIYEDVVVNDLSYSEIAALNGISRQGVYDLVKRCDKILSDYEDKLGLVGKFINAREKLSELSKLTAEMKEINNSPEVSACVEKLEKKYSEILEAF